MHPAGAFQQTDCEALEAFIAHRGLALIVAARGARAIAAHAPVLVGKGTLRFHLSGANRLVEALSLNAWALAVVTGADAYISPDWYAAPDQVPTWNYLSAEIEGPVRRLGRLATARLLDDLAEHFEAKLAPKPPWTRAKMDPKRFAAMLGAIVGFELTIERFEGTAKLSQNKPAGEIARLAAHLTGRDDAGSVEIGRLMQASPSPPARKGGPKVRLRG